MASVNRGRWSGSTPASSVSIHATAPGNAARKPRYSNCTIHSRQLGSGQSSTCTAPAAVASTTARKFAAEYERLHKAIQMPGRAKQPSTSPSPGPDIPARAQRVPTSHAASNPRPKPCSPQRGSVARRHGNSNTPEKNVRSGGAANSTCRMRARASNTFPPAGRGTTVTGEGGTALWWASAAKVSLGRWTGWSRTRAAGSDCGSPVVSPSSTSVASS